MAARWRRAGRRRSQQRRGSGAASARAPRCRRRTRRGVHEVAVDEGEDLAPVGVEAVSNGPGGPVEADRQVAAQGVHGAGPGASGPHDGLAVCTSVRADSNRTPSARSSSPPAESAGRPVNSVSWPGPSVAMSTSSACVGPERSPPMRPVICPSDPARRTHPTPCSGADQGDTSVATPGSFWPPPCRRDRRGGRRTPRPNSDWLAW
jgi:hypothetical protein